MQRTARSKAQTFALQALLFPIISIALFVIETQVTLLKSLLRSSPTFVAAQTVSMVVVAAISLVLAFVALSKCKVEEPRVVLPSIIGLAVSGCLLCVFFVAICVGMQKGTGNHTESRAAEIASEH